MQQINKEKVFRIFIVLFIVLGLFSIGLYFYVFHGTLTNHHSVWAEFGSFIGGVLSPIVGILAFIGLYYNLDLTKKQFKKNNEDNTFFKMIELHTKKVESTSFFTFKKEITGYHAFKEYTLEYNKLFDKQYSRIARNEIASNYEHLTWNAYSFIWEKFRSHIDKNGSFEPDEEKIIKYFKRHSVNDNLENLKAYIGTEDGTTNSDYEKLVSIGFMKVYDGTSSDRVKIAQHMHEYFYQEYGHILGHYFRNLHYTLDFIDNSGDSEKYSKIFRAQLSRYELALIFYNSLSSMSSNKMVELIIKYDILNGLYNTDISYEPTDEMVKDDLKTKINNAS